MSSTAIGRAALILTTNSTGLKSGLSNAGKDVMGWAGKLGGAALGATAGVIGVKEAMDTLDDVAKGGAAAKAFGLTAEQFTGMAGIAKSVGGDQREFIESLVTLGKVAAEGAAGKGEVAVEWFKTLNLDAKQFNALNLEEKFFTVYDALNKIQDPGDRVRALMVAFGEDGGKNLLPLLSKSGAEIRSMAKGFAISTGEVEKATTANTALNQAGNVLKAGWRSIVVALAPVFTAVGKIIQGLQPVFGFLGRAIEAVIDVVGPAIEEVVGFMRGLFNQFGGWISSVTGLGDTTWTVKDVVVAAFRAIGTAGALVWDTFKAGVGVVLTVLGGFVSGLSYVTDAFSDLVGLAKKLPDSIKPSWVDGFADGAARASALVQGTGRKLREWGADAVQGWGNSAIQFNRWLDGIGNQTKEQAKAAAKETVAAAQKAAGAVALTKFDNASLLKGSSAEVSYRIKNDFKGQTAQEKMLEEQKKAVKHLGGIDAGVKKIAARPLVDLESF